MDNQIQYAPGARVVIRDAEWLVRKVDRTSSGSQAITAVGISELVKDKEAVFLSSVEKQIEILDPVDTKLVPDTSSSFQASMLYMESLLRRKPPTDTFLYLGHQAAMDLVPEVKIIVHREGEAQEEAAEEVEAPAESKAAPTPEAPAEPAAEA